MTQRLLMLMTVLALSVSMGCTRITDTHKWMAGGAALGATVGGVWAAHAGILSAGEGALAGAAAGATLGALIGESMDDGADVEVDASELDALKEENARLRAQLEECQEELAAAKKRIAELEEQLRKGTQPQWQSDIAADVLFATGRAELTAEGKSELDRAAQEIKSRFNNSKVIIEGHADERPIRISGWRSNWELAAARALAVLHYLIDQGVAPHNLSAATFGRYQPRAEGNSAEAMAQNRRASIVVYENWPYKDPGLSGARTDLEPEKNEGYTGNNTMRR